MTATTTFSFGDPDFSGWAIVELDAVPDGARTPKESAPTSKRYLERLALGAGR